jgi:Fe-S cluster assembly protein SufD
MLFADGKFVTGNGALAGTRHSLAQVLSAPPAWALSEIEKAAASTANGILALNTALMTDGAVIDIPAGTTRAEPIHVIFHAERAEGEEPGLVRTVATRNIIRVGKGAKVTLVEAYAGERISPRHRNAVTHLLIEDGAEVRHLYQAETNDGSVHLAHLTISMGANATYKPFVLTSGNGLTRNDLSMVFAGQHSTFDLGGLALGTNASHADTTLVVDHAVPHCTSRELYHSVLGGEAKSVFQGKVIVRPNAQKTDGKQMARALMLSPNAEFDSKPELEIYADDVICGHGSTSVEIDADMLFYCRSRGIPLAEARALLVESFAGEAAAKIDDEALRELVLLKVRDWLTRSGL